MIRAIIIDDERESRNTIINILNNFCKNIQVVAQAENVKGGIEIIEQEKPDAVFLDIQMPDGTGFDLLDKLNDKEQSFQVIFITAYDQYALKAIKFSALDYILKPVDPQLLIDAVEKLKTPETRQKKTLIFWRGFGGFLDTMDRPIIIKWSQINKSRST